MKVSNIIIFILSLLMLPGCYASAGLYQLGQTAFGPSHPPNSEAQWVALENQARAIVNNSNVVMVERLSNTGAQVSRQFRVQGNTCYNLALAWNFSGKAYARVTYDRGVNLSLGGKNGRIQDPGGSLNFCVDNPGKATLAVSALGITGAIKGRELLEYAMALSARKETWAQTVARRKQDAAKGQASAAVMKKNIAAANAREEREKQQIQRNCGPCKSRYYDCVNYGGNNCLSSYQECQFNSYQGANNGFHGLAVARRKGENVWPCGKP